MITSPGATAASFARTQARFPVVAITREAFTQLFENISQYLRIALPWALALLAVWLFYQHAGPAVPKHATGDDLRLWFGTQTVLFTLLVLVSAAIAVPWHQRLLLGPGVHRPRGIADARCVLRLTLFMFLLTVLPNNAYLVAKANGYGDLTASVAYAISLGFCGLLVTRWAFSLPAIASGAARASMSASWNMTRGHAFRILAGYALLVGCVDVFYRAARLVLGAIVGTLAIPEASAPLASLLSAVTWTLAIGLFTTYLTQAYRFLASPGEVDILRDQFN
jgi:hypothetical protein